MNAARLRVSIAMIAIIAIESHPPLASRRSEIMAVAFPADPGFADASETPVGSARGEGDQNTGLRTTDHGTME